MVAGELWCIYYGSWKLMSILFLGHFYSAEAEALDSD